MSNARVRALPQRVTARGNGSKPRHFRLDNETERQLQAAMAWYEERSFSYSESCIVRVALRDLLTHLLDSNPADEEEIIGRIEEARAGR
jgi:hypothetical protein